MCVINKANAVHKSRKWVKVKRTRSENKAQEIDMSCWSAGFPPISFSSTRDALWFGIILTWAFLKNELLAQARWLIDAAEVNGSIAKLFMLLKNQSKPKTQWTVRCAHAAVKAGLFFHRVGFHAVVATFFFSLE